MKILFLGFIYSDSVKDEYLNNSQYYDFAGTAFQENIIKGLSRLCKINIISVPNIIPRRSRHIIGSQFSNNKLNDIKGISIDYYNIHGVKQILLPKKILKAYEQLDSIPDIIIVYAADSTRLKVAAKIKEMYPRIKVIVVVADLPEYMSPRKDLLYKALKLVDRNIINKYLKCVDGYILLTKYMKDKLPIDEKPYIVIEGMSDIRAFDLCNDLVKDNYYKQILYSGTLSERFGIITLIKAFKLIENNNIQLLLCGDGDAVSDIKNAATQDGRIRYLGKLPHDEVFKLQSKATLLVNPREYDSEYTKYSFPSKTIEYLMSGTPTLIYQLPGIPDEYYNYCFTIRDKGVIPLKNKIEEILSKEDKSLRYLGIKAREFVTENKSIEKQTDRIYSFLERVLN